MMAKKWSTLLYGKHNDRVQFARYCPEKKVVHGSAPELQPCGQLYGTRRKRFQLPKQFYQNHVRYYALRYFSKGLKTWNGEPEGGGMGEVFDNGLPNTTTTGPFCLHHATALSLKCAASRFLKGGDTTLIDRVLARAF
jgi:hypothetical protein